MGLPPGRITSNAPSDRLACVLALAALVVPAAAAARRPRRRRRPVAGAPATIEVLKDGRWLFTYAEPKGTFATTDKPESVPEDARAIGARLRSVRARKDAPAMGAFT